MRKALGLGGLLGILMVAPGARAQHGEHQHPEQKHAEHQHAEHQHQVGPQASADAQPPPLAQLESRRIVSGTAWQPPDTPHAGLHAQAAGWRLMAHALLFAGYDWQGGDRGADAAVGVGWFMGMAERETPGGLFTARVMLSPEFVTVTDGGYPLLLQTGETYKDLPLHDRQHPHDLLMEAGIIHTQQVGPALALQLYGALAGEPALGPPGFPHRASAGFDPLAPLGHHWQDSTHISFGVVTLGMLTRHAKLEGSWFNGREPDETRHDVEFRRPDAFSVRLSVNASPGWVAQISYGYLPSPEILRADEELHRMTASASHQRTSGGAGPWATTLAMGLNKEGHGPATRSLLLESTLGATQVLFGRAEYLEKAGHDLQLGDAFDEQKFRIGSLVLGYLYNFPTLASLQPGLGLRAALNALPSGLKPFYGTRFPVGGMIYLRLAVAPAMSSGAHH